jgi:hypothetical protein
MWREKYSEARHSVEASGQVQSSRLVSDGKLTPVSIIQEAGQNKGADVIKIT